MVGRPGTPQEGSMVTMSEPDLVADPAAEPAADGEASSDSPLAEAARAVAGNREVQQALQSVVDLAMANCNCHGASVTLVRADGGVETTASSGSMIEQAD